MTSRFLLSRWIDGSNFFFRKSLRFWVILKILKKLIKRLESSLWKKCRYGIFSSHYLSRETEISKGERTKISLIIDST